MVPVTENADPSSLEELMRGAQQGDSKAYARLLTAITPPLRSFMMARLGSRADAEDLVQNTLLSIHKAGHTYDSARPFKAWMFAIARYNLNDHLRKMYRKDRFPEFSLDGLADEISTGHVTESHDRSKYLYEILEILPERQKKIVVMMKIEGYSAEDVAKVMNMSVSAVKVAAHRAYKALMLHAAQEQ